MFPHAFRPSLYIIRTDPHEQILGDILLFRQEDVTFITPPPPQKKNT